MKLNIIYDKIIVTILLIVLANQINAQILNGAGSSNLMLHETTPNANPEEEYSGLAYHTCRDILFMPLDNQIDIAGKNDVNIFGYYLNGSGNKVFYPKIKNVNTELTIPSSQNTNANNSVDNRNDLEGLTYLEQDYFVLVEERTNYIYFLEYKYNNEEFEVISKHNTGIQLSENSNGLEGVTYDPHTNRLFLVQEVNPPTLFCFPLTLPGPGNSGSINASQKSSLDLTNDLSLADAAGLFHLGKVVPADSQLANNLLILSEQSKKIYEVDLTVNNNQNTISINPLDDHSISSEKQPEGIAVLNDKIYIASERGDNASDKATLSSYPLSTNFLSCQNFDTNCNCIDQPGCMDACASNYNPNATEDDGSCNSYNTTCNTNCTTGPFGGIWNAATCACIYETMPVNGCTDFTACNYDLAANCDDGSCLYVNQPCDDGNDSTGNDIIRAGSCACIGTVVPGCMDGSACNYEPTATVNSSCVYPDSPCDSGNPSYTFNDDCLCVEICPTDIDHSGTLSSGLFKVSNSIKSTADIDQDQQVTYDAGASICLDKGFLADSGDGILLLAKIEGCSQLREGNVMEQMASIKNYPNPFTGETTIEFEINKQSKISLVIADVTGKAVETLISEATTGKGKHQYNFNAYHLPQGIYYCTLFTNNQVSTQKMILMK